MSQSNPARPLHVVQFGAGNALYGAERWILALIRYLDPARVRTTVVTLRDGSDCPTALVDEASSRGFDTHLIDAPGRLSLSGVREFADYCRAEGVDLVHSHGYKPDVYGLLARRRGGYRLVCTPHGWNHNPAFRERVYEAVNRWCFPFCDVVCPLSDALFEDVKRMPMGSRPVRMILNGVDTGEVAETSPALDADLPSEGGFTLGYVGQLIPRKGLDTLLAALAGVADPQWNLWLIGEGPERDALAAQATGLGIADRVHFLGFRSDRLALMKRMHAFALPSYGEGIPRCLMEALATPLPVLASDIDGVRDLVTDGETGTLFPAGDVDALRAALDATMADPTAAQQRAEAGQRHVEAHFSARRMAAEYHEVYRDLLQPSPISGALSAAGHGPDAVR